MLLDNRDTHAPNILDPRLKSFQACYVWGYTSDTLGYVPSDALIAERAKNVTKQSSKPATNSVQKPAGRGSEKSEGSKRSVSTSSEKSSKYDPNERENKSEIKLSYGNSAYALLENSNKSTLKTTILANRKATMAGLCSGTVVENEDPPILHSVTSSNSCSRIKNSVNPKGNRDKTMVYGKIFEDAACRPTEQSVWCGQCLAHHPVHTQEPCIIIFMTEDQELANGTKSHRGGLCDPSFRDRVEEEGITHSQIIHIEFIDVRDGGAFADNTTWLSALLTRECNCRGFIF